MTAHILARLLLEGPDLMVTVRGYEGGVDEIATVNPPASIYLDYYHGQSYYGKHQYVDDTYLDVDEQPVGDLPLAIHIGR